jgi:hypothetical protein
MTAIVTVIVFSPSSFNHALRRRQEDRRQFDVILTKRNWSPRSRAAPSCERRPRAKQPEDGETIARSFPVASGDVSEFFDESESSFDRNPFGAGAARNASETTIRFWWDERNTTSESIAG